LAGRRAKWLFGKADAGWQGGGLARRMFGCAVARREVGQAVGWQGGWQGGGLAGRLTGWIDGRAVSDKADGKTDGKAVV
jgi:hypothetical protein